MRFIFKYKINKNFYSYFIGFFLLLFYAKKEKNILLDISKKIRQCVNETTLINLLNVFAEKSHYSVNILYFKKLKVYFPCYSSFKFSVTFTKTYNYVFLLDLFKKRVHNLQSLQRVFYMHKSKIVVNNLCSSIQIHIIKI